MAIDRRLPDQIEAAGYFLATEAVTNAVKHSHATSSKSSPASDAAPDHRDRRRRRRRRNPRRRLGLRGIADRIEALDGRFTISSPPGRGTPLRAEFPCASRSPTTRSPARRPLSPARRRRLRRRRARRRRRRSLALVERTRPDVAIIDIRMPPAHTDEGLRAAKVIRARWPATGILVLSQHVNTATRSNCSPPGPTASATCSRSASPTSTSSPPASTASGRRIGPRPGGRRRARRPAPTRRQPARAPHRSRTRSARPDRRRTLKPRDRRAAVRHRAHHREARQKHPRHAAPPTIPRRPQTRARRHHLSQLAVTPDRPLSPLRRGVVEVGTVHAARRKQDRCHKLPSSCNSPIAGPACYFREVAFSEVNSRCGYRERAETRRSQEPGIRFREHDRPPAASSRPRSAGAARPVRARCSTSTSPRSRQLRSPRRPAVPTPRKSASTWRGSPAPTSTRTRS